MAQLNSKKSSPPTAAQILTLRRRANAWAFAAVIRDEWHNMPKEMWDLFPKKGRQF